MPTARMRRPPPRARRAAARRAAARRAAARRTRSPRGRSRHQNQWSHRRALLLPTGRCGAPARQPLFYVSPGGPGVWGEPTLRGLIGRATPSTHHHDGASHRATRSSMVKSEDFTQPMDAEADVRSPKKVAMLTAGGLAPCLSSAVGALITESVCAASSAAASGCSSPPRAPFTSGTRCSTRRLSSSATSTATRACCSASPSRCARQSGRPPRRSTRWPLAHCAPRPSALPPRLRRFARLPTRLRPPRSPAAAQHGGSPIGNSRVKLTNIKDCLKRGLVKEGQDPQQVAADQLIADGEARPTTPTRLPASHPPAPQLFNRNSSTEGVEVLHTIGGDDTNTAAADLAAFLQRRSGYAIRVIGAARPPRSPPHPPARLTPPPSTPAPLPGRQGCRRRSTTTCSPATRSRTACA